MTSTRSAPTTSTIRIWQSFSCNNSSSYRLVAKFADEATAKETATELRSFFAEHAKQMDEAMSDGNGLDGGSEAAIALAKKYGFEWTELFGWGDEMLEGDEPIVESDDKGALLIWHSYCSGFPTEMSTYLEKRGAKEVERQDVSAPPISVLFRLPKDDPRARDELTALIGERIENGELDDLKVPWSRSEVYGAASFFCDGETLGFCAPLDPGQLDGLRTWLKERGVLHPSIRISNYGDHTKFDLLARVRCVSCKGALKYLDPRVHGIETEQLACAGCGGMFELSSFK